MISVLLEFLKTTLFIGVVFVRLVLPDILRRANYAIIKFIYRNIRVTPHKMILYVLLPLALHDVENLNKFDVA